jgi:hypothetical protein
MAWQAVRGIIAAGGHLGGAEWCVACGQGGEVVCCDTCAGVYHAGCAGLAAVPPGAWHCPACIPLLAHGVTNALRACDRDPAIRIEPLGSDAAWRTYWFLARRVVAMDMDGSVAAYYTTADQLRGLMGALAARASDNDNGNEREAMLLAELTSQQVDLEALMRITETVPQHGQGAGSAYTNKHARDLPRPRPKFSAAERFRWPGPWGGGGERTDLAVLQRLALAEAAIPAWLHSPAWAAMRPAWKAKLRPPLMPHAAGLLLVQMVRHIKPNAMAKAWRVCLADPYPRRTHPAGPGPGPRPANKRPKPRGSAGLAPPALTPRGRLVAGSYSAWMWVAKPCINYRPRGSLENRKPLADIVAR